MKEHHAKQSSALVIAMSALLLASCGPPKQPSGAPGGYTAQAAVAAGAPGAPCNTFRDCQSQACVRGVCAAPAPVTPGGATGYVQACGSDSDCASPNYCILGTCRPLGQMGETCKIDLDCVEPLVCTAGTCSQPGGIGEPCKSFMHCVAPLACWNGVCSQCTVTGVSATTGTPCCDDANCTSNLYCILGTCRPIGGAGCQCGIDDDCDSMVCENGTCLGGGPCWEKAQGLGGPCAQDTDCAMPLGCIGGICSQLAAAGAHCTQDNDCEIPLACIQNACRPLGNLGDTCATFADCVAPLACEKGLCAECLITGVSSVFGTPCCDDSNCTGGLYCIMGSCRPLGMPGDACAADMDCDSDYCLGGTCQP